MLRHLLGDDLIGLAVDAERLLAQQMLARAQDIDVELRVQVVRHGAVDRLDLAVGQQIVVIGDRCARRAARRVNHSIAAGLASQTATMRGSHVLISRRWLQRAAALANSRPISPQPMMPNLMMRCALMPAPPVRSFAACSGVAPSWTMAISACVMPRGLACCTTLRP